MKKRVLKSISVLLVVVMFMGAAPLSGFVGLQFPQLNFRWLQDLFPGAVEANAITFGPCGMSLIWMYNTSTKTLTIAGSGAMMDYTGYDQGWYAYRSDIKKVVLPSGITRIGSHAFSGCSALSSITLVSGLKSIGKSAFENCGITSIAIPSSVTSIDHYAFSGSKITSITIPATVTSIGTAIFQGCTSLKSATFSNAIKSIGACMFEGCTSLTSVSVPSDVTSIGKKAFYSCTALKSISLPNVSAIGEAAFEGCTSLANVSIPKAINIGANAFFECTSLAGISIPEATFISSFAFRNSGLKSIEIPIGITHLLIALPFAGCASLTSITLHSTVRGITSAFSFRLITTVTLTPNVTSISASAFSGYDSLTTINIPETLTSIGSKAFENCSSLEQITLLDNVTSIAADAFKGCSPNFSIQGFRNTYAETYANANNIPFIALDDLVMGIEVIANPDKTKYFRYEALDTTGLRIGAQIGKDDGLLVPVPLNSKISFSANANKLDLHKENIITTAIELTGSDDSPLIFTTEFAVKAANLGDVYTYSEVRDNITITGVKADMEPEVLAGAPQKLEIPGAYNGAAIAVGAGAFSGAVAETVVITAGLSSIADSAFAGAAALKNISVDSKNSVYSSLDGVLYSNDKTKLIAYPLAKPDSYFIAPSSVSSFGSAAFTNNRSITALRFTGEPPEVTAQVTSAFSGTDLTVYCDDTLQGWHSLLSKTPPMWHRFMLLPYSALLNQKGAAPFKNPFIVTVLDKVTGAIVKGAAVSISSAQSVTDSYGRAYFDKADFSAGAKVLVDPLGDYAGKIADVTESNIQYIELTQQELSISGNQCNGFDISKEPAWLNKKLPKQESIIVRVEEKAFSNSIFHITKVALVQGNTVVAEQSSNVQLVFSNYHNYSFTVDTYKFQANKDIEAWCYRDDGSIEKCKLYIKVANCEMPSISSLLLNLVNPSKNAADWGSYLRQADSFLFDDAELSIKKMDSITLTLPQTARNGLKYTFSAGIKDTGLSITGFLNFIYTDSGLRLDGEMQIKLTVSAKYGASFTVVVVPIRLDVKLNVYAGLRAGLTLATAASATAPAQIKFSNPTLKLLVGGNLSVYAGVGCKVASAGVYGKAGIDVVVSLPAFVMDYMDISGDVGLYVKYNGLFVKWEKDFSLWNKQKRIHGEGSIYSGASMYTYDNISFAPRAYLAQRSDWYSQQGGSDFALQPLASDLQVQQSSTYPYIEPQLAVCGDDIVMVYLDDRGDSDDYNFSSLVYCLYDKSRGTWSEPQALDSTDYADLDFVLATDGNQIYVAYSKVMKQLDASAADDISTALSYSEICTARFDPAAKKFTAFATLTNNACLDFLPELSIINGTPTVLWQQNINNDMFGYMDEETHANTNKLLYSSYSGGAWNTAKTLVSDVSVITSTAVGALQNKACAAFILDEDGDYATEDDRVAYAADFEGNVTRIETEANGNASLMFTALNGKQSLVWTCGGKLYSLEKMGAAPAPLLTDAVDGLNSNLQCVQTPQGSAFLFVAPYTNEADQAVSDIFGIFYDAKQGAWGQPVQLSENGDYVSAFAAVYTDDQLLMPLLKTKVTFEGEEIITESSFCTLRAALTPEVQIMAVTGELEAARPGETFTASVWVKNTGPVAVDSFTIDIPAQGSKTFHQHLMPGETVPFDCAIQIPDSSGTDNRLLLAIKTDASQHSFAFDYSCASLEFEAKQLILAGKDYLLVTAENTGNVPVEGTLQVLKEVNGETAVDAVLMDTISGIAVPVGDNAIYRLDLDERYFDGGEDAVLTVLFDTGHEAIGTISRTVGAVRFGSADTISEKEAIYPAEVTVGPVSQPPVTEAVFDKNNPAEIVISVTEYHNNYFAGISNAVQDTDYTIQKSLASKHEVITLHREFLQTFSIGANVIELNFMSQGGDSVTPVLITVKDSSPIPIDADGTLAVAVTGGRAGQAEFGETLEAEISGLDPEAQYVLEWLRNGKVIGGAQGMQYTVAQADIGCALTARIRGVEAYTGTAVSEAIQAVKVSRTISAGFAVSKTKGSITLSPAYVSKGGADGTISYGYALSNDITSVTAWQSQPVFTGLAEDTAYYFFTKITGGAQYADAAASHGVLVKTASAEDDETSNPPEPKATLQFTQGEFTVKYRSTAQLHFTGTNAAGYTWSSNHSDVTVDNNGQVTSRKGAKTAGATITVKDADEKVVAVCQVKVKPSFGQWMIIILLFGWIWY